MPLTFLQGTRIVESSAFIAAPLAGLTLAQFGADVIRVDSIGGGIDYRRMPMAPAGRSLYWTGLNKGKRSFAVDLRNPEGQELVRALVTAPGPNAGILLTNIGSGWLAHHTLAKMRTDLISCTIEGNWDGSTALDYTVNCATGLPAMTGPANSSEPVNHVLPAWDIATAHQAAFAITAAIIQRMATGEGAELRLALSDVAFATLSHLGFLGEAEILKHDREPIGNYLYGAFGKDFVTSDGTRIYVAAVSLNQWRALMRAVGAEQPLRDLAGSRNLDFDREEDRFAAREAINDILAPWFASRSLAMVAAALDKEQVCWGRYQTLREGMVNDPRLGPENALFSQIDTAGIGSQLAAGPVVRERGKPRPSAASAPLLGEHTDMILSQTLGLSAHEVRQLHQHGIVAGPQADPLMAEGGQHR